MIIMFIMNGFYAHIMLVYRLNSLVMICIERFSSIFVVMESGIVEVYGIGFSFTFVFVLEMIIVSGFVIFWILIRH